MELKEIEKNEMLTYKQKNANKKQWYKDKTKEIESCRNFIDEQEIRINFNLMDNIIDKSNFNSILKPYGEEVGELPTNFKNVDIISTKINTICGIEKKRPFEWQVLAVNPEATTRKEQEETERLKQYVVSQIMNPLRKKIEEKKFLELNGKTPSKEELNEINQKIDEETQTMTPEEVKTYMSRKHQDPVEAMSNQLLQYLIKETKFQFKINECFKKGLIGRRSIMYVGAMNGEPVLWSINPKRFFYEKDSDNPFIEDSEHAVCEFRMFPSDVIKYFGEELTKEEIQKVYKPIGRDLNERIIDLMEDTNSSLFLDPGDSNHIIVKHYVWKSLRNIGFLTYKDLQTGEEEEIIVSEDYELNEENGDIKLEWKWIPEVYETWKINDIFVRMRPIPGQFKDIDNIYKCKLPYYGVDFGLSIVDSLKVYQYLFDVIMYRLELLIASDKGKKLLMNINAVPNSKDFDLKKWQYFFEATPLAYFDPSEEGVNYSDVNTIAKVLDMSLLSDIKQYIELSEYIRGLSGKAIGVPDQMEGQIAEREAVGNVKAVLAANSNILEPIFSLHNIFKRNVLEAILEVAKVVYKKSNKKKLVYMLDDMSQQILNLDFDLLDNSTLGLYITDSTKSMEVKDLINTLAQDALQYQKVEFSDIITVVEQDSIIAAKEALKASEERRRNFEEKLKQMDLEAQEKESENAREFQREQFNMQKELTILKEEERRKTEIIKAAITSASFNPDADADDNGMNDYLELAKQQLKEIEVKHKNNMEERKFKHQQKMDMEKLENDKRKVDIQRKNKSQK